MVVSRAVKPVVWSRQASENISSVSLKPVLGCKIVPCKEIKVEMDSLKTPWAYCAFLLLVIKLCDLLVGFLSGLNPCVSAVTIVVGLTEIHPVVCSTFLLWWEWNGRLLLCLWMGSQDIKWWMFRSARIKELLFHCCRGLRGLVFAPWVCHLLPELFFWVPEAFLFLCQPYFNLHAAV